MTLYLVVNNVAAQAFQTALLLFVVSRHSAGVFGFVVAASGAGFFAGAAVSPAAARWFGTGRVIIVASLAGALGIALVAVSGSLPLVIVGAAVSGAGPGMLNLHSIAVRQAITPPAILGRVTAVVKTLSYAMTTVGALLGGLLSSTFSARTVIWEAAVVSAAATLFPALSAVRRLR